MMRGLAYLLSGLLLWTFAAGVSVMNHLAGPSAVAAWLMPAYWALLSLLVIVAVTLAFIGIKKPLARGCLWVAFVSSLLIGLFLLLIEPELKAAAQEQAVAERNQRYLDNALNTLQCQDNSSILLTHETGEPLTVIWLQPDKIKQPSLTLFRHYRTEESLQSCRAYRNEYQLGQQRAMLMTCRNAEGDQLADLLAAAEKAGCVP